MIYLTWGTKSQCPEGYTVARDAVSFYSASGRSKLNSGGWRAQEEVYSTTRVPSLYPVRFLQGWTRIDDNTDGGPGWMVLPHTTILPGLQFTLAGMIGKPSFYYEIPFIRFLYELLSYM